MVIIQFVALFLTIIIFILVIGYGARLIQKTKSEADKKFVFRYFIILAITFTAGGVTRTIQQSTGIEWLNGFVPIFGGLFMSLWGVPFFWRISKDKMNGLKGFLLFLPGLFFVLLGVGVIYLGITQVWDVLS
jgi:hypothetical protein